MFIRVTAQRLGSPKKARRVSEENVGPSSNKRKSAILWPHFEAILQNDDTLHSSPIVIFFQTGINLFIQSIDIIRLQVCAPGQRFFSSMTDPYRDSSDRTKGNEREKSTSKNFDHLRLWLRGLHCNAVNNRFRLRLSIAQCWRTLFRSRLVAPHVP